MRMPQAPDERFFRGPWELEKLFPRRAPLEIEFGSGKARFLIESGHRHPESNFLGVERNLSFYRVARGRLRKSRLENVRLLRADAVEFVPMLPPSIVTAFHIYFPDPWPKKRQKKRRLLTAPFLALLADKAAAGGHLRVVTDHPDYALAIAEAVAAALAAGSPWEQRPWDSEELPPATHYEIKYTAAGRTFFRFLLWRVPTAGSPQSSSR